MMNMQMHTPIFTTLAAMLACPFVAVFDFFANAFPVGGILPFGYATFPSGVILSAHSASIRRVYEPEYLLYAEP